MPEWRDHILQHFQEPIHRLTLVADPDGLMLEEELLASIRQNGFGYIKYGVCSIGGGSLYTLDYIPSAILVDLHSPVGGEEIDVGEQFEIDWSVSRATPDSISILASLNSGATYDSISISAGPSWTS